MGFCSYCGETAFKITKEHLWPTKLHSRLMTANKQQENAFWLRKLDATLGVEPTIRDVCAPCNNGFLSNLDGYACTLFDNSFSKIVQRYETVKFVSDYHQLKRWLLKVCYNSARVHTAFDVFAYQPLLPYIRGVSDATGRSVHLYAHLTYPDTAPAERVKDGVPRLFEPTSNRVGFMNFTVPGVGRKVMRTVHIRSYSFFLAFFEPKETSAVRTDFDSQFLAEIPNAVRLRPSSSAVSLVCDGWSAWDSFEGSRVNQIVVEE
ncbi:hypothetical protein [Rhizobium laguerreae]|uniref:hypothetical protein n=1 Tax=Rhizobium laguerreae TaxID=1076926 RepID=UPI001C904801|nr:hypothetical protein [Rhizobium laguerreae]MBY3167397.1 hypothetical protein [Rhizobium laguerreae]